MKTLQAIRTRRSSILALAVSFSGAIASACLAAGDFEPQQPNLVTNPSAEETAANGLPKGVSCLPGARYAFSFWYKGTVPAAKVTVTGWPSETADHHQRITVPVDAQPLRPGDPWQQCAGSFRIPAQVERFVVLILASGQEAKGFRLGKLRR